jgi:hypothetical protein
VTDAHDPATCLQAREEAAVSLLSNRLPSPAVRTHLEACPPCHEEYLELAALPPLLDGARDLRRTAPETPPSPLLLERLLAHVSRRRRRRRIAGGFALLAAAATVLAVVPLVSDRDGAPPRTGAAATTSATAPAPPTAGAVVALGSGQADSGASAQVSVRTHGRGRSTLSVVVRGVRTGTPCRMMVYDRAGAMTDGGVWTVAAAEARYTEDVEIGWRNIERVELWDDGTGQEILDLPVREA